MCSITAFATQRRRAHAFERRDAAGALRRPVHAARVELDDAVRVRQAAVADAVSAGSSSHMLTPAISASSTSAPFVIMSKALLHADLRRRRSCRRCRCPTR